MNLSRLRIICCCGGEKRKAKGVGNPAISPILDLEYCGFDKGDQTETRPLNRRPSPVDRSLAAASSLQNIPSIQTDFLSDGDECDDDEVFRNFTISEQHRNSSILVEFPTSTHNTSLASGMEAPIQAGKFLRLKLLDFAGERSVCFQIRCVKAAQKTWVLEAPTTVVCLPSGTN